MADSTTNNIMESGKVLEFWREFDLDGKRLALDKQVINVYTFLEKKFTF
jgi:protein tyrosine/serine phosphatase